MELTERCNNNCVHCYINLPVSDKAARAREMSTDQVKDVLRRAADLGCLQVRFTGGEPLLRRDFEDIYVFARRLGLKVLIFTNARRITKRLAGLWKRIPPLVPIEVTVYGMHQESYEAVSRVPGSFAQFRRGVERLLEYEVPFIVKGALLPPNRHEVDEFEAWAATLPAMEGRPAYSMFLDLRSRRDDPHKNEQIAALRVKPEEGVKFLTRDAAKYRKNLEEFRTKFMGPHGDRLFACGAGRGMSIDAYGFAQPCMGLRAPELTVDTRTSSLAGILERFAALRGLHATDPEYLARCAKCALKGLCEQCPAKSWAEHGTLDTPVAYLCEVAHAQARFLGWLGPKEDGWES
jgi:radical SAM protein with 4Fe4S-binding SPASM domain